MNRTRARHKTSELHQVRMRDDPVGDVDREVIARIARASLRHEDKVPWTVVSRAGLSDGGQGNKRDYGCQAKQRVLHRLYLRSDMSVATDIWEEECEGLFKTASIVLRLQQRFMTVPNTHTSI